MMPHAPIAEHPYSGAISRAVRRYFDAVFSRRQAADFAASREFSRELRGTLGCGEPRI
jgi:hypothetical protein